MHHYILRSSWSAFDGRSTITTSRRSSAAFAEGYRNETPAHPGRGFVGREQVRANWQRILAGIPDMCAEVSRIAVDGDVVWSEWEMRGTRLDGNLQVMRGVIIFGIADDRASWARFYLEPVDAGEDGVDGAVGRVVGEVPR